MSRITFHMERELARTPVVDDPHRFDGRYVTSHRMSRDWNRCEALEQWNTARHYLRMDSRFMHRQLMRTAIRHWKAYREALKDVERFYAS
jgi:hypothetical protein